MLDLVGNPNCWVSHAQAQLRPYKYLTQDTVSKLLKQPVTKMSVGVMLAVAIVVLGTGAKVTDNIFAMYGVMSVVFYLKQYKDCWLVSCFTSHPTAMVIWMGPQRCSEKSNYYPNPYHFHSLNKNEKHIMVQVG